MLNGASLEGELRDKIWAKRIMNVTYLSNIISTKSSLKCPFELLHDERPTLHDNLEIFGKVGVVTTKEKIQASLSNQVTNSLLVAYTKHSSREVYRMLNLTTNSIINSCNIIRLNKTYKAWYNPKTIITEDETQTIELPIGMYKTI
jgi:hypothetical protein